MFKLYIDADGCPVVYEALNIADEYNVEAVVVCDSAHVFRLDDIKVITVDKGMDSVDYAILNRLKKHDIVVTQDYGLAAMALSKQAYPISQNGLCYTNENIDGLLNQRHDYAMLRRAKKVHSHIKKRTSADDDQFCDALRELLEKVKELDDGK